MWSGELAIMARGSRSALSACSHIASSQSDGESLYTFRATAISSSGVWHAETRWKSRSGTELPSCVLLLSALLVSMALAAIWGDSECN